MLNLQYKLFSTTDFPESVFSESVVENSEQTDKQTDKQQTDRNRPMTVNKLYTSLPANHITAKQTNHVQQTRLYNIID